jgi:hypothetical protein
MALRQEVKHLLEALTWRPTPDDEEYYAYAIVTALAGSCENAALGAV